MHYRRRGCSITAGRLLVLLFPSLAVLSGCGAAQMVLKGPLTDKCTDTGLKGCPEIVDGVLAYVEGNKPEGEKKLKSAAAENAPDKLQDFAATLEPLLKLPGVESYARPIREVVDLLASAAKNRDTRKRPAASESAEARAAATDSSADAGRRDPHPEAVPLPAARFPTVGTTPDFDVARMRTRTVAPASDARSVACEGPLAVTRAGVACTRVPALIGPFVITDLYAPGGCGDDLFVSADSADSHGWLVFHAATAILNMHGARLVVQPDEKLYVGARTDKGPLRSDILRCSITLTGSIPDSDQFE